MTVDPHHVDAADRASHGAPPAPRHPHRSTQTPMWGYPVPVLGAISPFVEPFRGRLSPNIYNVSEKLTLRYPHEGPWVVQLPRRKLSPYTEVYSVIYDSRSVFLEGPSSLPVKTSPRKPDGQPTLSLSTAAINPCAERNTPLLGPYSRPVPRTQ